MVNSLDLVRSTLSQSVILLMIFFLLAEEALWATGRFRGIGTGICSVNYVLVTISLSVCLNVIYPSASLLIYLLSPLSLSLFLHIIVSPCFTYSAV